MKCGACGFENADGAKFCMGCGSKLDGGAKPVAQAPGNPCPINVQVVMQGDAGGGSGKGRLLPKERSDKSRTTYTILGVALGFLGVHNFYLGRTGVGVAQLLITLLSFGCLFWVSWIWAAVDLMTVEYDTDGRKLI